MQRLDAPDEAALRPLLGPERPGPLVAEHVLTTGNGALLVDEPAAPALLLAMAGGNRALHGSADAKALRGIASRLQGLVAAPASLEPALRQAIPDIEIWNRVILRCDAREPARSTAKCDASVRRLEARDAAALWSLPDEVDWIADTWGGPPGLAASGHAWGAFRKGELISVASSFFVGSQFEDIGVVTVPGQRGAGASPACTAALSADIRARGRIPSWSTSPDNTASLRVAEKLGFTLDREDRLFVIGQEVPGVAQSESSES